MAAGAIWVLTAEAIGIPYRRLRRAVSQGLGKPDQRNASHLQRVTSFQVRGSSLTGVHSSPPLLGGFHHFLVQGIGDHLERILIDQFRHRPLGHRRRAYHRCPPERRANDGTRSRQRFTTQCTSLGKTAEELPSPLWRCHLLFGLLPFLVFKFTTAFFDGGTHCWNLSGSRLRLVLRRGLLWLDLRTGWKYDGGFGEMTISILFSSASDPVG